MNVKGGARREPRVATHDFVQPRVYFSLSQLYAGRALAAALHDSEIRSENKIWNPTYSYKKQMHKRNRYTVKALMSGEGATSASNANHESGARTIGNEHSQVRHYPF